MRTSPDFGIDFGTATRSTDRPVSTCVCAISLLPITLTLPLALLGLLLPLLPLTRLTTG